VLLVTASKGERMMKEANKIKEAEKATLKYVYMYVCVYISCVSYVNVCMYDICVYVYVCVCISCVSYVYVCV